MKSFKKDKTENDYLNELGPLGFDPDAILDSMREALKNGQHPDVAKFRIKRAFYRYNEALEPSKAEIETVKKEIMDQSFLFYMHQKGVIDMSEKDYEKNLEAEAIKIIKNRKRRWPFTPLWPW